MAIQEAKRANAASRAALEQYLQDLTHRHVTDPDINVEFACYFVDSADADDVVDLLEVSPTVLDPGDEEFYAVNLATPHGAPVGHVRITLVAPAEFARALANPESRGGRLIKQLKKTQAYRVLVGADTRYARDLQRAAR